MLRIVGLALIVISILGLAWQGLAARLPAWKQTTQSLIQQAKAAGIESDSWDIVVAQSQEDLPSVYPFTVVQSLLSEARDRVKALEDFQKDFTFDFDFESGQLSLDQVYELLDFLTENRVSLERMLDDIYGFPNILISQDQEAQINGEVAFLEHIVRQLKELEQMRHLLTQFEKDEDRVLIVLQNQNEPRSTGGFMGSVVVMDFKAGSVSWEFKDIYSLDRLVPSEARFSAPEFFHNLSTTISLRDANMDPHFPASAEQIRTFFKAADQKVPDTIVTLNLRVIEAWMEMVGAVRLEKWGLDLEPYNFDLLLQFLVESKIAGRYEVKTPVKDFARVLLSPQTFSALSTEDIATFDIDAFKNQKNILAYSRHRPLQRLFETWDVAGMVRKKREANNVLMFDFISIGANKSDKFVWTNLDHNSTIAPDGRVLNTLKIKRTHALGEGELETLLGVDRMWPNIADLITGDLMWKLGEGQNRTMLRLWIPSDGQLLKGFTPSGEVALSLSENQDFQRIEIPLFVAQGESIEAEIQYLTTIDRGSSNWRPYHLQLIGTPGRDKTQFTSHISTTQGGAFRAETLNVGRPVELVDQDFEVVIEWE